MIKMMIIWILNGKTETNIGANFKAGAPKIEVILKRRKLGMNIKVIG